MFFIAITGLTDFKTTNFHVGGTCLFLTSDFACDLAVGVQTSWKVFCPSQ